MTAEQWLIRTLITDKDGLLPLKGEFRPKISFIVRNPWRSSSILDASYQDSVFNAGFAWCFIVSGRKRKQSSKSVKETAKYLDDKYPGMIITLKRLDWNVI